MQVVWFKRDLRTADHGPLTQALSTGAPVICLYVYEPIVYNSPTYDQLHHDFINQSLAELACKLQDLGLALTIRQGDVIEVLAELASAHPIHGLWSHQETGETCTYKRDKAVARWCRQHQVDWQQLRQFGVWRGPYSRDGWANFWQSEMSHPQASLPDNFLPSPDLPTEPLQSAADLGIPSAASRQVVQLGGGAAAQECLDSFLNQRGLDYRSAMSSPLSGENSCSRLSPHLAFGTISIRSVFQQTRDRQADLRDCSDRDPRWLKSLSSFQGRLRWHCHFIQKLEDQPELEFQNMSRAYDGLRESEFDEGRFRAWCNAETGYPMVDACMRFVQATGWLNFRMRAMLVSFASYHLWLDWRPTSIFLARHFLDYEPGIHYSQFQMQSGVTGINAIRIYSPAKQVVDQDPKGEFIRRWLPELANVPTDYLAEPHKMPELLQIASGCIIGSNYPAPIVDHATAMKTAKQRIYARRKTPEAKAEAAAVYQRHGSRRRPRPRQRQRAAGPGSS